MLYTSARFRCRDYTAGAARTDTSRLPLKSFSSIRRHYTLEPPFLWRDSNGSGGENASFGVENLFLTAPCPSSIASPLFPIGDHVEQFVGITVSLSMFCRRLCTQGYVSDSYGATVMSTRDAAQELVAVQTTAWSMSASDQVSATIAAAAAAAAVVNRWLVAETSCLVMPTSEWGFFRNARHADSY